jgi:hypothetical protein
MIEVSGAYVFDIEIGKYKNFIMWDDLIEFSLHEEAGCVLPYFDLSFKFNIDDIRNYLVENNPIIITFGTNKNDAQTLPFRIVKKDINKLGQGYWMAKVYGRYNAIPFIQETGTSSIKGTATEAIKSTVAKYFRFETNVVEGEDDSYQTWLRCKKTASSFVTEEMWSHSNIKDTFTAVSITKDGKFRFMNMGRLMTTDPKWVFTYNTPEKRGDVRVSGSPDLLNDTGVVNMLTQNKKNIIYNMDTGITEDYTLERKPLLATTSTIEQNSSTIKDSTNYITNSNVHDNYWQSFNRNIGLLTFFSGVRTIISYLDTLIPNMEVLDMSQFLDYNPNNPQETEGLYSGKYIIAGIHRVIGASKNLQTHVVLSREALNQVKDYEKELNQINESNVASLVVNDSQLQHSNSVVKVQSVESNIKSWLSLKDFNINIPNIRTLSSLLSLGNEYEGVIGFDLKGVWIKESDVLTLSDSQIAQKILQEIFLFLESRGESLSLLNTSEIITELNSGIYSDLLDLSGNYNIPNLGDTLGNGKDFTSNVFSWYVMGLMDSETTNTGNTSMDDLIAKTVDYLKTTGIINQPDSSVSRRFWGVSEESSFNDRFLKLFFSDESSKRYIHKIIPSKGTYIYVMHPTYMGLGTLSIDGTVYTNLDISYRNIKINDIYYEYIIYRTKDKFNRRSTVEIV